MLYRLIKNILRPLFGDIWWKINDFRWRMIVRFYRTLVLPRIVRRVAQKDVITVVFLPISVAMWRYDGVYRRMRENPRFKPIIVAAPKKRMEKSQRVRDQDEMLRYFGSKGYDVRPSYDPESDVDMELRDLHPDIVFYAQPATNQVADTLNCWHMRGSLICYAHYSYQYTCENWEYNLFMHNFAWRHYVVAEHQRQACQSVSDIRAANVAVVGYSLEEEYRELLNKPAIGNAAWRNDQTVRKRIIWAPHHSISDSEIYRMSSFLEYCDFMLELKERYKDRILFAFKPHPFLYSKLCEAWGEERAAAYYDKWRDTENSFIANGTYSDLFAGSDAMIHCCASFTVEYLYAQKPALYVWSKTRAIQDDGPVGGAALAAHDIARSCADIEQFVEGLLKGDNDKKAPLRRQFYLDYLASPNGRPFSENVVNDIVKHLSSRS